MVPPGLGVGVVFEVVLNESTVVPTTHNYNVADPMKCLRDTYKLRHRVQPAAQLTVGNNEGYHIHTNS